MHLLFQESADTLLEMLIDFVNLTVLALLNCNLEQAAKNYFDFFGNLERLYLWQCHPNMIECAKRSGKSGFSWAVSSSSPLSDILYE